MIDVFDLINPETTPPSPWRAPHPRKGTWSHWDFTHSMGGEFSGQFFRTRNRVWERVYHLDFVRFFYPKSSSTSPPTDLDPSVILSTSSSVVRPRRTFRTPSCFILTIPCARTASARRFSACPASSFKTP